MKPADVCLAVLVAVIWGLAFVASRIALDELSPELMTALRFAIAAVPCLFVRKPKVSWPLLIAISFTLFLGQFLAQAYRHRAWRSGRPDQRDRAEPGAVHDRPLRRSCSANGRRGCRPSASAIATVGLLMICGTVGYDFSVGAFAVLMICPICFAVGNLLLRPAQGCRCSTCSHGFACCAAIPLFALTLVTDGPQPTWHALSQMSRTGFVCMLCHRRYLDQHRLLAVGPAAAGLSRGASGAVRAAGAVRRLRGIQHRVRRTLRAAAARRHDHRGLRHRDHAAVEACAGRIEIAHVRTRIAQDCVTSDVAVASDRLCGVCRGDVFHAGAEQHHAAVVWADLRLPPHLAAYRGHHGRVRLHGRRGGRRAWNDLHRLSGAADHPEICRRRLSGLSRGGDRDVRSSAAGPGQPGAGR